MSQNQSLSAAELHALVNGEYTMPDGSKRRGLWERVWQSHPSYGNREYLLGISDGDWAWVRQPVFQERSYKVFRSSWVDDASAAALIRVAIEDWARQQIAKPMSPPWATVYVGTVCLSVEFTDAVQAAHVVADALSIPH